MNIKLGAFNLATLNKALINFSLSPNHLLNKSAEDALKNVALHSVAAALASKVFPHPGGPNNSIPDQGFLAPLNKSGFNIGSTIASLSACLQFSNPAISAHLTFGDSVTIVPDIISNNSCSSSLTPLASDPSSDGFASIPLLIGRPPNLAFKILALLRYSWTRGSIFWRIIGFLLNLKNCISISAAL